MTSDGEEPGSGASGKVFLVGGGPGDPGLITVRGAECLAAADLVLYDGLVNPLLLQYTSGVTERTARIRRAAGDEAIVPQEAINRRLIAEARAGKTVVRLKGGDPCIFGRGSEEARALAEAGVPFEIVPGVTAATAAGEYAGFSFTDRTLSSAVALVTGHEDPQRDSSRLDYASLARFPGTLVFYMGLSQLPEICRRLTEHGLADSTPAAVVCHASLPRQQVVEGTLSNLADRVRSAELRPPSLISVGDCVRHRAKQNWFEKLPLFGLSVAVTRAASQFRETAEQVVRLGGEPVPLPLLSIEPADAEQQAAINAVMPGLADFAWLIFTSTNAVTEFCRQLRSAGRDARALGSARIAAVGEATATALQSAGLLPDAVPETWNAEALAETLRSDVEHRNVLWLRGSRAKRTLPEKLQAYGAHVTELVVYNNHVVPEISPAVRQRLLDGTIDWIAVASPVSAATLADICRTSGVSQPPQRFRLAAISEDTAAAACNAGLSVDAVAAEAGWGGLIRAIAANR